MEVGDLFAPNLWYLQPGSRWDLPNIAFAHAGPVPTIMGGGDSSTWVGGSAWDNQIGAWDDTLTYDITSRSNFKITLFNENK